MGEGPSPGEESQQQRLLTDSCEGCEERSAALAALSLSPSPPSSPSPPTDVKSEATSTSEPPTELKLADTSPINTTTTAITTENTTSETTSPDHPPTHSPDESAQPPPVPHPNRESKTPEIAFATVQEESLQNDASSTHSVFAESAVTAREHLELEEEDLDEGVEPDAYQAVEHEVEQDDHDGYQDVEHDIHQLEDRRSDINRDSGLASDMDDKSEPPSPIDLDGPRPVSAPIVLNSERVQIIEELADESDCSEYDDGDSDCGDGDMEEGGTLAPLSTHYHSIRPSGSIAFDTRSIAAKSIGDRSLFAPSIISPEDEVLSMRVRSLYDSGLGGMGSDSSSQFSGDQNQRRISSIMEENAQAGVSRQRGARSSFPGANREAHHSRQIGGSVEDLRMMSTQNTIVADSKRSSLAGGGVEDWDDLEGQDVDRYGFINNVYIPSSADTPANGKGQPKRIATELFNQSQEPRKRPLALTRTLRLSPSAPEMLKTPNRERSIVMRDKENTRSRKWRNMATRAGPRPGSSDSAQGSGAEWSFNTSDSKLISRTWKGIPDCWRGAAWHSFLTESYKKRGIGRPDYELIQIYSELLERPSADDVQIDLDVPRTISSHVMFRRRYRGGQRLLFRVLHSLALYNPDIGYVQGMASIAATLLCYYEETTAFIMMVRLWELRGLERLYEPDFTGLMTCLNELETSWMKGSPIAKKLFELGIQPTAYATRWYLTLFNYSIPFAAQLRVWDVFILLGDPDEKRARKQQEGETDGTFDVLHATGAAILDGLKGIILKADFEEGMKNLTSFVPVKDEDTLMRVVKSEWRRKRGNRLGL